MSVQSRAAVGYRGDVTVADAFAALTADPNVVLLDVRSAAEWTFVGQPDLSGLDGDRSVVSVEWVRFPGGARNVNFVDEVRNAGVSEDATILTLCRSGGRSAAAAEALTTAGFVSAYNITGGFEGDIDTEGHRGVGGWKAAGLPWRQT